VQQWLDSKRDTAVTGAPLHQPRLNVLLREKGQVTDFVEAVQAQQLKLEAIDTVTLDFEFGRDYQASVEALRSLGCKVGLATTRILKPNEYRNLKVLLDLKPDSILVRNLGALYYLQEHAGAQLELRGDFSLNVTNHVTAAYLFAKGLKTLTLSYDLNQQQVSEVLSQAKASQMEVTIYQYMPSFHMEHCVFAAFLSEGSSFRDCGKPCEQHEVRLKDQFQNWHQIKADQECRNTMFNAKAQSAGRYLEGWAQQGLGYVRYEALKERGEELVTKLSAHIDLLEGRSEFAEMKERIGAIESYGLSEGQFGRDREYQSRKKPVIS
jgi:putative protease